MSGAQLQIAGIPVRVAPEFLIGAALPFLWAPPDVAIAFAVCLAGFMLVHELGHASVARSFGAETSITLSFLVGWASYQTAARLSPGRRAAISVAGPAVQVALGVALLLVLGTNPVQVVEAGDGAWVFAIWWAGLAIGLLNLLPLYPLDGGHLVEAGLEVPLGPTRAATVTRWWTLVAGIGLLVLVLTTEALRSWWLTVVVFLGWGVVSAFRDTRPARPTVGPQKLASAARHAEDQAWRTGRPGLFPPPYQVSSWFQARTLLASGRPDQASTVLVGALGDPGRLSMPPTAATDAELMPLVGLLPAGPLPTDNLLAGLTLVWVLQRTGDLRRAAEHGAALYSRHRSERAAQVTAESLELLGQAEQALVWHQRAQAAAVPGQPGT